MSVEWVGMGGTSLWSPAEGTESWSSAINSESASNPGLIQWRLGGDPSINQHVGKVVRGIRVRGAITTGGDSAMVMTVLNNIAETALALSIPPQNLLDLAPVPAGMAAGARYNFDWRVDRTALPIGSLNADSQWWNAAGSSYGGVRTVQPVDLVANAAGGGKIMRASPGVVQLLVSDPPTATLDVAPQLFVGQSVPAYATLSYPGFENDPVEGIEVSLSASPGTQVGLSPQGAFGAIARTTTNVEGKAFFWVKGVSGGSGQLLMDIAGDAPVRDPMHSTVGFTQRDVVSQVSRSMAYVRGLFQTPLPIRTAMTVFADPVPPNPGQCATYPEIPGVPGIPPRTEVSDDYGWNSGANSLLEVEGDFELRFDEMEGGAVGAVIGVMPAIRENQGDYTRVTHGFYFTKTAGGTSQVSIIESGRTVAGPMSYPLDGVFTLQRIGTSIIYMVEGGFQYTSLRALEGTAMAATSLFATSDQVPSTDSIGDCFWTDIVFADQVCGLGPGPGPDADRTYIGYADNGVAVVRYTNDNFISDFEVGILLDGGQWKLRVAISNSYFPKEEDDYMEADVIIRRLPRVTDDPYGDAAFVANINGVSIPKIFNSNNGGNPDRFYGDIDGLPSFDPAYVYLAEASYSIYNAVGELVTTGSAFGAVFDPEGEGDATAPLEISIVPTGDYPSAMNVQMRGINVYINWGEENATLFAGPQYSAVMEDFTCDNFMASIDGQPVAEIIAMCS